MSLANLIKKGGLRGFATATPATFATHSPFNPPTVATVATVAVAKAPDRAANDPAPDPALLEAQRLTARLIEAAMRRCDEFGDSEAAREEMRRDCLATPAHLRADLLEHFQETAKPTQEGRAHPSKTPAESKGAGPAQLTNLSKATADPNAWRELAAAYHEHHFSCPQCKAAGRGAQYGLRCGTGAALWRVYQDTP